MERRYGIPCIYRRPYGYKGTTKWIEEIASILRRNINESFIEDEIQEGMYSINFLKQILNYSKKSDTLYLGGNHDVVKGILELAQIMRSNGILLLKKSNLEFICFQSQQWMLWDLNQVIP